MIRPITVICWILALGAGLYLYRAKHEVELMDKHIEQVAKETSDVRADSRRLLDDWLRLGEPEQLHKYSDEYLGLRTIAPTQFARVSDLTTRLPAPQADPPAQETVPVAQSPDAPPDSVLSAAAQPETVSMDSTDEPTDDDLPVPPIPPTVPLLTTVALPAVTLVPLQVRPVTLRTATAQPDAKPKPAAETRIADEPRMAPAKPVPLSLNDPRQTVAGRPNVPNAGQPAPIDHGLPPLQAQIGQVRTGQPSVATARQESAPDPRPQNGQTQEAQDHGSRTQGWQAPGEPTRAEPPQGPEPRSAPPRRPLPESGLPPLQAQGASPVQGTVSARGPSQSYAGPAYSGQLNSGSASSRPSAANPSNAGQPVGRPIPWSAQSQTTETRPNDPRRDTRPAPPPFGDPRGPQTTQQTPTGSGSLLGMPHSPVPLPLPAPTPVSATWAAPAGSGR